MTVLPYGSPEERRNLLALLHRAIELLEHADSGQLDCASSTPSVAEMRDAWDANRDAWLDEAKARLTPPRRVHVGQS